MSSNTSESNSFSTVTSPAPQVRQQANVNLTGVPRKIKDIAADFHNLAMKWESLNARGMDLITKISNILIEKVFNVKEMGDIPQTMRIAGSDEETLLQGRERNLVPPLELNPLCDLLTDVVDAMSTIETKMRHKVEMTEGLISLQKFDQADDSSSILFSTMTLKDIANSARDIHQHFQQELKFKREFVKHVAFAEDRTTAMFYSTCWMHQPYLPSVCQDQIQALLKETGHVV